MPHRNPFSFSHGSETTHWDHPELVNTFKSLIQFNTIRSSKLFQLAASIVSISSLLAPNLALAPHISSV